MNNIFIKPKLFTSKVTIGTGGLYPIKEVRENSKLTTILAGYKLTSIEFLSQNVKDVTISIGTTVDGSDIISSLLITGNMAISVRKDYIKDNNASSFDLYITSVNWNSARLNISIITCKI